MASQSLFRAKRSVCALRKGLAVGWLWKCALGISLLATNASVAATCSQDSVDLRWDGGSARFAVEVADDNDERARGLMFRESLGRYAGMLFIYERPLAATFWMKNTLIPLDMIFLDSRGVVQKVHANAVPGSLEGIHGGDEILAVLEINGGLAAQLGIVAGAEMRHPAFMADAVWPCE